MKILRIRPASSMEWALVENAQILSSGCDAPYPDHDECELVLPAAKVLLIHAALPKSKRLSEIAAFAIEDSLISDPEKNRVLPVKKLSDGKTLLAVIDKEWMKNLLSGLENAGILPARMFAESLMPPLQKESWSLFLDESGGFLKLGEDSAHAIDSNGLAPPVGLRLALQSERRPSGIFVHAGKMPDLDKWQAELGIACHKGMGWDWKLATGNGTPLFGGEYSRNAKKFDWHLYRPAFLLSILMILFQLSSTLYQWGSLAHEKHALLAEMDHIFRKSFPDARVVVDAPLQMQRKLEDLRRSNGEGQPGDFLALLAPVSARLAGLPPESLSGIDYSRDGIDLLLDFPSKEALDDFRNGLEKAGIHAQIRKQDSRGEHIAVSIHIDGGDA
ncbi:MAG: hypothetical protein HKL98_06370 [Burkholderiales bacterium]|nr:hypothetical protein [Burkholderiales bacterium]